jgi:predicted nucleotidyltransferase
LITFQDQADAKKYFGVLFYLEDLLHRPIDLITETALRPELKPYINAEKIDV